MSAMMVALAIGSLIATLVMGALAYGVLIIWGYVGPVAALMVGLAIMANTSRWRTYLEVCTDIFVKASPVH